MLKVFFQEKHERSSRSKPNSILCLMGSQEKLPRKLVPISPSWLFNSTCLPATLMTKLSWTGMYLRARMGATEEYTCSHHHDALVL